MNLQGIVAPVIAAVNPQIICTIRMSIGSTPLPDGTRVPAYRDYPGISVQVQALSYTDLMKLGGLNITGIRRKVYLNGNPEGLDRQAIKGGDLFVMPSLPNFPGPTTWLVAQVLEHWADWCTCAITLQNGN
jgi:hypothetical protein